MKRAAFLALALLAGCDRGTETNPATAPDTADQTRQGWIADTQYVVDSSGARLMIIQGRPAGAVREVVPRAGSGDPEAPGALRIVEPRIAHSMMQAAQPEWYLIDLRPAKAYVTEGHLHGAKLVPLEALAENLADLHVRTDQMVLLYAESTPRAWQAARILAAHGFPNLRVLEGGLPAWQEAGLLVEKTP